MKTFNVTCLECGCELDVDIEEADLTDPEIGHLVTCADCQTETEYVYDADLADLVPTDEDETDETDDTPLVDDDEGEDELG